jgi:hypothetical protein
MPPRMDIQPPLFYLVFANPDFLKRHIQSVVNIPPGNWLYPAVKRKDKALAVLFHQFPQVSYQFGCQRNMVFRFGLGFPVAVFVILPAKV